MIGELHHPRDRGVETHRFGVFGDLLDGLVKHPILFFVALAIGERRVQDDLIGFVIDCHSPNAVQEIPHSTDAGHHPRLGCFERPHEHLVQTQRISTKFTNDHIWIDDIAAALGHFVSFRQDLHIGAFDEGLAFAFLGLFVR